MRIAIIGSGIAGLGASWLLSQHHDITIFEKQDRLGGHCHTVEVATPYGPVPVDTGFIVYNEATYPNFINLMRCLDVQTELSDMSFAVSMKSGAYEYAGDNLGKLIGSLRNIFSPSHWLLVRDLVRFMNEGQRLCLAEPSQSLGAFLHDNKFSQSFIDNHLLPMAAAIWSASPKAILDFPARSFGDFFRNHGLLEIDVKKRPLWRTITGGSRTYVHKLFKTISPSIHLNTSIKMVATEAGKPKIIMDNGETQEFDHVIIATHADEAYALLAPQLAASRQALSQFSYSANSTYLHSDTSLMPKRKRLWASWNYLRSNENDKSRVFVSYWMNRLQSLDERQDFFVSLNPPEAPAANKTWKQMIYHHPQFDTPAIAAQTSMRYLQGRDSIWFCGSYFGYGFHEDALSSGLAVAEALGSQRPWQIEDVSPALTNATPARDD